MEKETGERGYRIFPENGGKFRCWGEIEDAVKNGAILFAILTDVSEIQAYPQPERGMLARIMEVSYMELENPAAPQPSGFSPIVKIVLKMDAFNIYNQKIKEENAKAGNKHFWECPPNGLLQISCFGTKRSEQKCLSVIAARNSSKPRQSIV